MMAPWLMILLTALASAGLTLAMIALWMHFWMAPRMARDLEELLSEQSERAADLMAEKVEEGVRRGVRDGVTQLPTREVLQDTTRNMARTSVEIVESRLGTIFGGRRRRPRTDDE